MRKGLLIAAAAALGLVAGNAKALTVGYNLAGSTLTIFGSSGNFVVPITGSMSIDYTDDGFGNPLAGAPASVANISGSANLADDPGLASIGISGTLSILESPYPGAGNALYAGPAFIGGGPGGAVTVGQSVNGTVLCQQFNLCDVVFAVPLSTPIAISTVNILQGANGTATTFYATQPMQVAIGSTVYPAQITFVPEPGTLLLLGAGVAGLGAIGRKRNA